MRAADCKYSELRTSRCQGDASLHHNHREDEDQDQEAMETVLMRQHSPVRRCGPGCVAPAAKTPQTSQDRNVLAMFWARPRWTMWRSQRGAGPSSVTAVYYVTML